MGKKPSILCLAFSASPLSLQAIYIQLSGASGLKSFSDYNSTTILHLQSFCRQGGVLGLERDKVQLQFQFTS